MASMLRRADFEGCWLLHRTIHDRLQGSEGGLKGQAILSSEGSSTLNYEETGTLRLGIGPAMIASRRYRWAFVGDVVSVTFEDGMPFHKFVPQGQVAGTDHPCGGDHYTVSYDFMTWPKWQAIWTVSGPRKNYVSTSIYTRADAHM